MSSNYGRIRFQLLINGAQQAVGGIASRGVMVATVNWAGNDQKDVPPNMHGHPDFDEQAYLSDHLDVRLGGLDTETEEHVTWLTRGLQPGDEVTIRVLPGGECDPPLERHNREQVKQMERELADAEHPTA